MSSHFSLLVFVTVCFLGLFFKFAIPIHSNTWEQAVNHQTIAVLHGLLLVGGYVALCALIFGHALLRSQHKDDEILKD